MKKTFPKKGFAPYESNSFGLKDFRLSSIKDQRSRIKDSSLGGFTPTPISRNRYEITNQHNSSNFSRNRHIPEKIGVSSQRERGFTLIELLVVISIIALLSSVVLAALSQARAKARDAQILSDIHTLATVMELYYDDHGYYPQANSGGWLGIFAIAQLKGDGTNSFLKSELNPYLKQLPNPSIYIDQSYKGAGGGIARISYNRPWAFKQLIYDETGLVCGVLGQWSVATDCYILTVRTETATTLGPAETRIYLIVGKNGQAKIIDTNNDYNWGLW